MNDSDALNGLESLRKSAQDERLTPDDLCGYLETLDAEGQNRVLAKVSEANSQMAEFIRPPRDGQTGEAAHRLTEDERKLFPNLNELGCVTRHTDGSYTYHG